MSKEVLIKRGDAKIQEEGNGQQSALSARQGLLAAKLESITERRKQAATIELAGPQDFWNVWAIGPYQGAGLEPGRLIDLGEEAAISVFVYLNPFYPSPYQGQNACDIITGFQAKIELNFITSNMQTMQPVPDLNFSYCIDTTPGQCWYQYDWIFTPRQSACIYETNICCRVCNCYNNYVRQYSGFVRWIDDLDYEYLFGPSGWQFDRPIRYTVSDPLQKCSCSYP